MEELCVECKAPARWMHPTEGYYLCSVCAKKKVKQFMKEFNQPLETTASDWFLPISTLHENPNLINISFNPKTGIISKIDK